MKDRFVIINHDNTNAGINGTATHVSPEVLLKQIYTEKVDIWAVG